MKKLFILIFIMMSGISFAYLRGDINNDNTTDIFDVILCLRQAVGLNQPDFKSSDLNFDGKIDISDVIWFARISLDLEIKFEIFPVQLDYVENILGLGNYNPRGHHVVPVNHMYINFRNDKLGSGEVFDCLCPLGGKIVMIIEYQPRGENRVWQVYIKVNDDFMYAFMYMNTLSDRIMNIIENPPYKDEWIGNEYPKMLIMEIEGKPEGIDISTGEKLGTFKFYTYNGENFRTMDWWVMDRRIDRYFVNPSPRRYPSFNDFLRVLGLSQGLPFNMDINAGRFPDYYRNMEILNFIVENLDSTDPEDFGSNSWDIYGKLQGTWFNPLIDQIDEMDAFFRRDIAAISITPKRGDLSKFAIAIGNMDGKTPDLAALDDDPMQDGKQHNTDLEVTFEGIINSTGNINPDPSKVSIGDKVAYELNAGNHIHTLLIYLSNENTCKFKIIWHYEDANSHVQEDLQNNQPDDTWITYIR